LLQYEDGTGACCHVAETINADELPKMEKRSNDIDTDKQRVINRRRKVLKTSAKRKRLAKAKQERNA